MITTKIYQPAHVVVKESPIHGRGVFALRNIGMGTLIEEAPAVFLPEEEKELLKHSPLFNYYFLINNAAYPAVFGFGYSSFYNHSPKANCFYSFLPKKNIIRFYALRKIAVDEEITINYNGSSNDDSPVYFPEYDQ